MSGVIAIIVALLVSALALAMDFSCGDFDDMTPWDELSSPVGTTPDDSHSPPPLPRRAHIQSVEVERSDAGYSLDVSFTLPDYCHQFEGYRVEVANGNIEVTLEIVDVSAGGGVACAQAIQELSENIPIEEDLAPGESYTVNVNGQLTNSFTAPEEPETITVSSPIESVELLVLESYPPQYNLLVISALPKGSSCSWFNGYDISSPYPGRIEVEITHHEATGLQICTADYPYVETVVPLGSDFEPGREYEIVVNGESVETFEAY